MVVGVAATVGWFGVDLWLDRINVAGGSTAAWLALLGFTAFAAIAALAHRVSRGHAGTAAARHVLAVLAAVLSVATLLVTTPWDERVSRPDEVRVEDALSMLKAGLVVMFIAAAIGFIAVELTAARAWRVAALAAVTTVTGLVASADTGTYGAFGLLGLPLAALAVTAARTGSGIRLLVVAVTGGLALLPSLLALYFAGSKVGAAMTALAGNPPVNGADTDLSIAFAGVVIGLLLASISYALTRPARLPADASRDTATVIAIG
jgi:hypothetical protein